MISFDIIETASEGYRLAWKERHYLVRLAAVPFLIKMVCCTTLLALGWEQIYLRQALIMLPSYFADGWLLSHLARLVFFEQRWPYRPTGNPEKDLMVLQDRASGIMRGTLTFVVIKFLAAGVTAILYEMTRISAGTDENSPLTFGMFIAAMTALAVFVWAFRLVWLYIPAAVNYSLRSFMQELGGYAVSWRLIGVWLVCFIPLFFAFGLILSVLNVSSDNAGVSVEIVFFVNFLRVVLDLAVEILATTALSLGFKKYFTERKKPSARS